MRRVAASRAAVFRAWTVPEELVWFENPGFPARVPTTVELRVGGQWRVHMVESETKEYVTGGVYREIVPDERLVFSHGAVGGWPDLDLDHLDDVPLVTIVLTDIDGGTQLALTVELADHLTEDEVRHWLGTGIAAGWEHTLARFDTSPDP